MKRLLVLALLFSAGVHAAGIKKWVDENGQIHYGDSPPAKVPSESIRVNRPPSNPGKPLPRLTDSSEEAQPGSEQPPQPAAAPAPDVPEDQAARLCQEAKSDLVKLKRSDNIRVRSADGTVRYMSAEEKAERLKVTEEDIQQFCE